MKESSSFRFSDFEVEKCRSRSHQPHRFSICCEAFAKIGFWIWAVYEDWKVIVFNASFYYTCGKRNLEELLLSYGKIIRIFSTYRI